MSHRIFMRYQLPEIEQFAERQHFRLSLLNAEKRQFIRDGVEGFRRYSLMGEVLCVNAEKFSESDFSLFLKPLEDKGMVGSIWFYGCSMLSAYPFTIRSRCVVDTNIDIVADGDRLRRFLEAKEAYTSENVLDMKRLCGYHLGEAYHLLRLRDSFVEFMMLLDDTSNFVLFASYLDRVEHYFVPLLYEWLLCNEIFSPSQLRLCRWLRTDEAMDFMCSLPEPSKSKVDVKVFFTSLLLYKLGRG